MQKIFLDPSVYSINFLKAITHQEGLQNHKVIKY